MYKYYDFYFKLEFEAKRLEDLLKEDTNRQSNDLTDVNLDYENNESPSNIETSASSREKRTIGRIYCSLYFASNPADCPWDRSRGIFRSILFPQLRQVSQGTRPIVQGQGSRVGEQQLHQTQGDFWLNYLGYNATETGDGNSNSNTTAVPPTPAPATTTTVRPIGILAIKDLIPVGRVLRILFPRLSAAFTQGYNTGSFYANSNTNNNNIYTNLQTNGFQPNNRNSNQFPRVWSPFRFWRNFGRIPSQQQLTSNTNSV